jgi:PLP dependent protein
MIGSNDPKILAVKSNWEQIQRSLAGRPVTVVGVTKFQPIELIQAAVKSGLTHLGNNYAPDGNALMSEIKGVNWHFIGHIQSRKVKFLLDYQIVESVDRLEIAEQLNQRLLALNRTVEIFVEVNIGEESQKSGVSPLDLGNFLKGLSKLPNLSVSGLMCMPPPLEPVENRRPFFRKTKSLFEQFRPDYPLRSLSMGTSLDYLIAVEEGANLVRLGTTLFGQRPAPIK